MATLLDPAYLPPSHAERRRSYLSTLDDDGDDVGDAMFDDGFSHRGSRLRARPRMDRRYADLRDRAAQRFSRSRASLGEGLATDDFKAPAKEAKKPLALGRIVLDATPDVLSRLDRITDEVTKANRTATFALGAVSVLGAAALFVWAWRSRMPKATR